MRAWGDPDLERIATGPRRRSDTVIEVIVSVIVLAVMLVAIVAAVGNTTALHR